VLIDTREPLRDDLVSALLAVAAGRRGFAASPRSTAHAGLGSSVVLREIVVGDASTAYRRTP